METYKNEYNKDEDPILWEIHEIRHRLHDKIEKDGISTINNSAKEILKKWRKQNSHRIEKNAS